MPVTDAATAQRIRDWFAAHQEPVDLGRQLEIVARDHPGLPNLTLLVMANDAGSAERATQMVESGIPFDSCLVFVGSYARIGWMLDMADFGHTSRAHVLDLLPRYWPGADPDDTDPRMLVAWMDAWVTNGHKAVTDGEPLPGVGRNVEVYRGQGRTDPIGIAWTTDYRIAQKFANGASIRIPGGISDPVVLRSRVARRQVLGYLTGRGESEVVIDPATLGRVEPVDG
jgi:hypothetical protein